MELAPFDTLTDGTKVPNADLEVFEDDDALNE
jgi:hypothetical protein